MNVSREMIVSVVERSPRVLPVEKGPDGRHCMSPQQLENAVAGAFFSPVDPMDPGQYDAALQELIEEGTLVQDKYPTSDRDIPGQKEHNVYVLH